MNTAERYEWSRIRELFDVRNARATELLYRSIVAEQADHLISEARRLMVDAWADACAARVELDRARKAVGR